MDYLSIFLLTILSIFVIDVLGTVFYRKTVSSDVSRLKARVISKTYYERFVKTHNFHIDPVVAREHFVSLGLEDGKFFNIEVSPQQYHDLKEQSLIPISLYSKVVIKKHLYFYSLYLRQSMFYSSQEETVCL